MVTTDELLGIADLIKKDGLEKELRKAEKGTFANKKKPVVGVCPECHSNLINIGGCRECEARCGYSECG